MEECIFNICCICGTSLCMSECEDDSHKNSCELNDGRWVCSRECWEIVVPQFETIDQEMVINPFSDLSYRLQSLNIQISNLKNSGQNLNRQLGYCDDQEFTIDMLIKSAEEGNERAVKSILIESPVRQKSQASAERQKRTDHFRKLLSPEI